jgi:hypothetical protein
MERTCVDDLLSNRLRINIVECESLEEGACGLVGERPQQAGDPRQIVALPDLLIPRVVAVRTLGKFDDKNWLAKCSLLNC